MARIEGVDLPRNKRVEIALTYIYGIGSTRSQQILEYSGVDPNTRVRDLTEAEVAKRTGAPLTFAPDMRVLTAPALPDAE